MKLKQIIQYLDNIFQFTTDLEPYGTNGLQIEGKEEVKKIIFCVDSKLETIQKAIKKKADMMLVHHGLFWPNINSITGPTKKKIKLLLENNISLVGMHLPLDKHDEIGNNIQLLNLLNAKPIDRIDKVGYLGELKQEKSITEITNEIEKLLDTNCKVFDFSKNKVKTFGACSGGGSNHIKSILDKCDLLITGELRYEIIELANEHNVSLIIAGHYATETLGIKALMKKMKKELNIKVEYVESKVDY